jgi:hypothetical protein
MSDGGWNINGEPATETEVVDSLAQVDLETLRFEVSIGQVVASGLGIDGAKSAAERAVDTPTAATFAERLCYSIAAVAAWMTAWPILGLDSPWWAALCVAIGAGMVIVNLRVGLGPLD